MRLACQPIARRANQEDEVDGRFFAKRFDCRRLETWADVLSCSIYVDLNVIRAGSAETPETSEFTSAYDRIRGALASDATGTGDENTRPASVGRGRRWLVGAVFLDERAEAYPRVASVSKADADGTCDGASPTGCNPIRSPRISNKGFLPVTRDQYLSLLDVLGRRGGTGDEPDDCEPTGAYGVCHWLCQRFSGAGLFDWVGVTGSAESEVKLVVVEPGDFGADALFLEFFGQLLVVSAQLLCVGRVVVGDEDRIAAYTDIAVDGKEEVLREMVGVPMAERFAQAHAQPLDRCLGNQGGSHLGVADVEVLRSAALPAE